MEKYSFQELDALNVCLRWFGGKMGRYSIYVASIPKSIMNDLVDSGCLRSNLFSWEITKKGRNVLSDNNINEFRDTRNY